MDKKKVFFFIDSLGGGGAERVVSVLANRLIEKDYSIHIVMLWKRPIAYELLNGIDTIFSEDLQVKSKYGLLIRRVFSIWNKIRSRVYVPLMRRIGRRDRMPKWNETSFYFYATYAMPYRELLKKNEDCTAFGFLIRSNISMLMAAKGTGVKTVFCERSNPIRTDMPVNIIKIRDRIYKKCTTAVFQTQVQKEYYNKIKEKVSVIPNPLKEGLPERYTGIRRKEIVDFCRIDKNKNIPLLIDAFELLLHDYPEYTLRVFGRGEERENVAYYIDQKGLENKVFLEDFADDIHERIVDAAMFVFTSNFEGLSNSMLEAMAIGLPTVCTDCDGGGARMMIQDHVNGILVPKGDVQAVYQAMKEIIENEGLAEVLSNNAAKIRDELSTEIIINRWEEVLS